MKQLITTLGFFLLTFSLSGQMWNGQDTLYGNEWIDYEQTYLKIKITQDGIYRLTYEQLLQAGVPVPDLQASQFRLFLRGEQVPIYTSGNTPLTPGDFLEFYGQKNRSELDRYLFDDPESNMLNPEYSLYTDSSTYFLTWADNGTGAIRYQMQENVLNNLPAPEAWHWATSRQVFTENHYKHYEKLGSVSLYFSHYDRDGFAHQYIEETNFSLPTPGHYIAGPRPELAVNLIGNYNNAGHNLRIDINNTLLKRDTFYGTQLRQYRFPLNHSDLSGENEIWVRGLNETDRLAVAFGRLRYPRTFSFDQESELKIELPAGAGIRYLELSGLGDDPILMLEPAANLRMISNVSGGVHRIALPEGEGNRILYLSMPTAIHTVPVLNQVQFTDFASDNVDYLIISNDQLYDDGAGNNWVQAYADYRSSPDGGNFRVQVLEIKQLFDQFAYGFDYHPLSIRNAFNFLHKYRYPNLKFVFLIGRGQEFHDMRDETALKSAISSGNMLLPSFGYPASDNLLFTTNKTRVSPVPLGRLAAVNGSEVKIYLDKVKKAEQIKDLPQTVAERAWTKHILHLGGGSSAIEQDLIRNSLESMADRIEKSTFGGSVKSFYKNSTDVIQNSLSQEIFDYINQGTSIITFFGHSSPGTFDFNIDNPDNYDNQGKYPFILSLGCYSGNLFATSRSIGERFTFYEDKAAVAFAASRGLGYISALFSFANDLYGRLGEDYYGYSIGEAMQATYNELSTNAWIGVSTLVEQFTLHGDPAIRLYPVNGPDYVIDASSATFSPDLISTQQDSLDLAFDIVNLGRNQADTFNLVIRRAFPDGTEAVLLTDTVSMDRFSKRFSYRLPVGGNRSTGQNTFYISIDTDNRIAEEPAPAAESNNDLVRSNGEAGISLFIIDNTARAIYPPEFALIGTTDISLKASTTDALAPKRDYIMELDTTAGFDSPLKQQITVQQLGGVLKWAPQLTWQDSTVYYWRVSPSVGEDNPEPIWSNSSFTYIGGSDPGWRQGHYWQFKANADHDLVFTDSTYRVEYSSDYLDMRVRNKLYDKEDRPGFFYNNDNPAGSVRPWEYLSQGITAVVFEPDNGVPWRNTGKQYGSVDRRNQSCFSYDTTTPEGRTAFMNFLQHDIPDRYIVFVWTLQAGADDDFLPEEWAADSLINGQNIFNVLEAEGAGLVRELAIRGANPYAFIYQKGVGPRDERISSSIFEEINVATILRSLHTDGYLSSKPIGPAASWGSIQWDNLKEFRTVDDTLSVTLLGIRANGSRDTLMKDVTKTSSLADIDADEYPYLQLKYLAKDAQIRDLAFLRQWTVYYEGVPELAINPAANYFFQSDTLAKGNPLLLRTTIENLSIYSSDSLTIEYTILDEQNEEQGRREMKAGLTANGQTEIEFEWPTDDMEGKYSLTAEVNPDRNQLEGHYFNNVIHQPFSVLVDKKNPVLDVTFDGQVILNGDLVGASPRIVVRLKDENPYLLLTDTSLLSMQLTRPNGQSRRIDLGSPAVQYTPATNTNKNTFTIEYLPEFTEDGTYALSVNGKDVSGNFSGELDYRVEFEVRTRNSISNVLNYPNPFSTSTQFVYTLTGSAPTYFKIQIMTASGRIVREITQDEIGPLQVGTHRTDFAWDGTDEFGDRLANGVYLYRIVAKDANGQDFESYDGYVEDTGLSQFFDRGFGKMVLLR